MWKTIKYLLFVAAIITACESVYVPDLDKVEDVLTVDAQFVYGQSQHIVSLKKSMGFNENGKFASYNGAALTVTDDKGSTWEATDIGSGKYAFYFNMDSTRQYKLTISAGGDIYTSDFEAVPPTPDIDTFFTEHTEQIIQPGGETDVDEFIKSEGHQFYVDIHNGDSSRYYRFDARRILQYYFPFDTVIYGLAETVTKYAWKSYYPNGEFNIAGPAEYSLEKDIYKHPTQFFIYKEESFLIGDERGYGWIYIMYQYGINQSAYSFYKDLNNQLDADGKIFDPLYVQARNNLHCETDPNKVILGYFEIASLKEHRFYIRLDPFKWKHEIRRVETFYDIPERGEKAIYLPWFWEL
ncbi:MAG: DUF4249 domain-containing protein [Mariniphaga sp.]